MDEFERRLILNRAAPELLEALRGCLKQAFKHEQYWLDEPGTDKEKLGRIVSICRDAIAKTGGE